jgi:hypothetical protein
MMMMTEEQELSAFRIQEVTQKLDKLMLGLYIDDPIPNFDECITMLKPCTKKILEQIE